MPVAPRERHNRTSTSTTHHLDARPCMQSRRSCSLMCKRIMQSAHVEAHQLWCHLAQAAALLSKRKATETLVRLYVPPQTQPYVFESHIALHTLQDVVRPLQEDATTGWANSRVGRGAARQLLAIQIVVRRRHARALCSCALHQPVHHVQRRGRARVLCGVQKRLV